MKKSIKFHLNAFIPTHVILGIGLMGMFSIVFAQNSPWTQKADMPTGRSHFTSSVVDERIYAIGGYNTDNLLTEYDPVTDTWSTKTPMPTSRRVLASGMVNGKIYAIGGVVVAYNPALSIVEEYDPATDSWTTKTPMPTTRMCLGTSVVDGKIYAIGGMTSGSDFWSGMHKTVEVYDPVTDTWSAKKDMPTARCWFSTSVVNGKIYAIGGALATGEPLATVEEYDPVTDTWTTKTPMPTERMGHAAAVIDGIIYVFGGGTVAAYPGGFSVVEAYDPATDTWTQKTDIPETRAYLCASTVSGKIYVIGGIPDGSNPNLPGEKTVYVYDPSSDITDVKDPSQGLNSPQHFRLHQNYPNPFNPATTITYSLSSRNLVTLEIYNYLGNKIQTLISEFVNAGNHSINFDASNFSSGLYFYKLQAGNRVEVRKMLLMK